jgi:hypothetical protein
MKPNIFLIFSLLSLVCFKAFGGYYVEFKLKAGGAVNGNFKIWYQNENTRSEIKMSQMEMLGMGNISSLTLQSAPGKIFLLNDSKKTYTESSSKNDNEQPGNEKDYEISVLETSKVNGYLAKHITLKEKENGQVIHFWLSEEVKGFGEMKKAKAKYLADEKMYKALKSKGVDGFPVKMKMAHQGMEVEMDLEKAEEMDVPNEKFSLQGYTKEEGMPGMPPGLDFEKIKDMSPAERQKFLEEMMKKYGR